MYLSNHACERKMLTSLHQELW